MHQLMHQGQLPRVRVIAILLEDATKYFKIFNTYPQKLQMFFYMKSQFIMNSKKK